MTIFLMTGFNAGVKETSLFSSQPKVPTASDLCTGYYGYPLNASDVLQASLTSVTKPLSINVAIRLNTLASGDSLRIELNDGGTNSIRVQISRSSNNVTWKVYNGGTEIGTYTKGQTGWFTIGFETDTALTRLYIDAVECLNLSGSGNGISWTPTIFKVYFTNSGSSSYVSLDNLLISSGLYNGVVAIYPSKPQAIAAEANVDCEWDHFPYNMEHVACLSDMATGNWIQTNFTEEVTPAQSGEQLFVGQSLPIVEGTEGVVVLGLKIVNLFQVMAGSGVNASSQIAYKNPGYSKHYDTAQQIDSSDGLSVRQLLLELNTDTALPWTIGELNNLQFGIKNINS